MNVPWIHSSKAAYSKTKKKIQKGKKIEFRKKDWQTFKTIRNTVVLLTREAKQSLCEKIANKLSSGILSKDWWSTLICFILLESNNISLH